MSVPITVSVARYMRRQAKRRGGYPSISHSSYANTQASKSREARLHKGIKLSRSDWDIYYSY